MNNPVMTDLITTLLDPPIYGPYPVNNLINSRVSHFRLINQPSTHENLELFYTFFRDLKPDSELAEYLQLKHG